MSETEKENALGKSISIRLVLAWGAPVIVAVVTATSWLVTLAKESEVAALTAKLDSQRQPLVPLSDGSMPSLAPVDSPNQSLGTKELANRIAALEGEKEALVAKLGELSRGALSPDSELGGLLQQLESDSASARRAAAIGLFELADSRAAQPLANYYRRDRKEATEALPLISYMPQLFAMDAAVGSDFILRVLQDEEPYYAGLASDLLSDYFTRIPAEELDAKVIEKFLSELQKIALTSKDGLVRTRAKILLHRKADWDKSMAELPLPSERKREGAVTN